ncbi:NlpC/P60 family protein [uncultured Dokdonia sp.]|uniref:C40 family peptidase n=1 Tax=uncultured Dokdonia sp. TaxID=575653 RepID=UPI0026196DBE|nr:NlpC/P60 family protein [uncultured Dokdonia sp.]
MKKLVFLLIIIPLLTSCGGAKKATSYNLDTPNKTERIVAQAQAFSGTRYKFGGTTSKGMDCSGLVYVAFQKENIVLPRVSRQMAKKGKPISINSARKGDLVFFKTNKNSRQINHVGLVTAVKSGEIYFIHSTTSKGVLTSSLEESYWKRAFVEARRVI